MLLQHRCLGASRRSLPSSARLLLFLRHQPQRERAAPAGVSTAAVTPVTSAAAAMPPSPETCGSPSTAACYSATGPELCTSVPAAPTHLATRCLSIVTGASRGLGAAIARVLAARGPPLPPPAPATASAGSTNSSGSRSGGGGGGGGGDARTPAVAAATAAGGSTPWTHHDLLLLASDSVRLGQFVERDLTPLLEQQQQQQQPRRTPQHQRQQAVRSGDGVGAEDLAGTSTATTIHYQQHQHQHHQQQHRAVTRVRTACFDLGDLVDLEVHTRRLLSAEAASAAAASGPGADPTSLEAAQPTTSSLRSCSSSNDVGLCCGGGGSGGVLPLPPSAYSHVLLIHNAGQVGDLLPLELQSLDNIRRQTDLNVTSFAHLTAAVLRTFLHAPLTATAATVATADAAAGEAAAGAGAGAESCSWAAAGLQAQTQQQPLHAAGELGTRRSCGAAAAQELDEQGGPRRPSPPSPPQQEPPQQRRVITIVNISSVSVDQPYEHFSLYGMGKAARHMLVRSVAHEAALREESTAATAAAAAAARSASSSSSFASSSSTAASASSAQATTRPVGQAPFARVRALSYAPGAIDTEMQAAAREALPAGPLKSRFEDNARCGRLVDPWVSAQVLYDILAADLYDNGAHVDYYSAAAGGKAAAHPLTRGREQS